ncbi:hypothetical protein PINS_up006288 [Pythium insidiosum]|nr:hypothetical protein PINS_up006288 [Pythium insidiosum]
MIKAALVKATLSSDIPCDWLSSEEVVKLLCEDDGNAFTVFPTSLDEALLAAAAIESHEKQLQRMKEEQIGVTLSINLWASRGTKANMMLMSILNAVGEAAAWKLVNIGCDDVSLDDLSTHIKDAVSELQDDGVNVIAVVADSLLAFAAAKAAVAGGDEIHSTVSVFPSFESFLVNSLGVILTISEGHVETMGKVIELVRVFSNRHLRDCLRRESGDPDATVVVPSRRDWYSFVDCIDSVRQYEDMIKIIATRAVLAQAHATIAATAGANGDNEGSESSAEDLFRGILTAEVLITIQNPQFWEMVMSLSELISPIKETYRLMKSGLHSTPPNDVKTTFSLADVFYQLGRMYQQYSVIISEWEENPSVARSVSHARYLRDQVNRIWKLYDQPLAFLAYTFNYNVVHPYLSRSQATLRWLSIGKYAKEYFRRWFCDPSGVNRPTSKPLLGEDAVNQFLEDILAYKERKYPFDPDSVCEFENPRAFYHLISDSNPLMHIFGTRLFSFATSAPSLAKILPGHSSLTRSTNAQYSDSLLLAILRVRLHARTSLLPSKEVVAYVHYARPSNGSHCGVTSTDNAERSDGGNGLFHCGVDSQGADGLWTMKEWCMLAKEWRAEWEHEGNVGNVLDTVAGLNPSTTSRLTTELLSLDQAFKDKLPSRLHHSREEAVVDV